ARRSAGAEGTGGGAPRLLERSRREGARGGVHQRPSRRAVRRPGGGSGRGRAGRENVPGGPRGPALGGAVAAASRGKLRLDEEDSRRDRRDRTSPRPGGGGNGTPGGRKQYDPSLESLDLPMNEPESSSDRDVPPGIDRF